MPTLSALQKSQTLAPPPSRNKTSQQSSPLMACTIIGWHSTTDRTQDLSTLPATNCIFIFIFFSLICKGADESVTGFPPLLTGDMETNRGLYTCGFNKSLVTYLHTSVQSFINKYHLWLHLTCTSLTSP